MRRFRADQPPDSTGHVRVSGGSARHLLQIVGIAPGENVELFWSDGSSATAAFLRAEKGEAVLVLVDERVRETPSERQRWLVLARLKGAAFDTALRMATELGVDRILPVQAERAIARGDRIERWERVIGSAVQQCGRSRGPEIGPSQGLDETIGLIPASFDLVFCHPSEEVVQNVAGSHAAVFIGPEGGWSGSERTRMVRAGARPLSLGRWVLRADTAVAAALAKLG